MPSGRPRFLGGAADFLTNGLKTPGNLKCPPPRLTVIIFTSCWKGPGFFNGDQPKSSKNAKAYGVMHHHRCVARKVLCDLRRLGHAVLGFPHRWRKLFEGCSLQLEDRRAARWIEAPRRGLKPGGDFCRRAQQEIFSGSGQAAGQENYPRQPHQILFPQQQPTKNGTKKQKTGGGNWTTGATNGDNPNLNKKK